MLVRWSEAEEISIQEATEWKATATAIRSMANRLDTDLIKVGVSLR